MGEGEREGEREAAVVVRAGREGRPGPGRGVGQPWGDGVEVEASRWQERPAEGRDAREGRLSSFRVLAPSIHPSIHRASRRWLAGWLAGGHDVVAP